MLIEQTTTYAYKLKYLENPSFDKVKTLAKKFIDELPKELVDDLFNAINRGVDILKTEPEMLVYLYSFGNMHKAKLDFAFDKIPEEFFSQPEINIIDYGCGQAIGTMCYADFLKSKNYNQRIKSVTLIEPSKNSLRRAALHMSIFFPDANIVTVKKSFDDLVEEDINSDDDVPTLHILSNVLNLLSIDLEHFAELVNGLFSGYNQFVCVGPFFDSEKFDNRMRDFLKLIGGNVLFTETFEKGEFIEGENWTYQVVVAAVGDLDAYLSTEVTKEDINNGEVDAFGVVYSKDGSKLLKCENLILEKYLIKEGTKVICDHAFFHLSVLQKITIPNSVRLIGECSFWSCESLQHIIIPNSVTSIGENAFDNCVSLQHIIIPNSVISIGGFAFDNCVSLQQILIPNSVISIESSVFSGCKSLQQMTIPNSVTSIASSCFALCKSLQQVTIPNSVTSIGYNAFFYCNSLQQITIPNSVTSIGNSAFYGCESLQQITIPNSVTSIGAWAFGYCKSLQHITIPNSVTNIGSGAFGDCSSLQQIIIPNSVTSIGDKAFCHCVSLRYISIPNSVTIIGEQTFFCCRSLQQITIPNSVTSIGCGAFSDCESLQQITLPDSVTIIEDRAFSWCNSLQQITLPNSITKIGKNAFERCESLQQIIIPENSVDRFQKLLPKELLNKLFCLKKVLIDNKQTEEASTKLDLPLMWKVFD